MTDLTDFIVDTITRYAGWSGPIIGILAFFESLLIVGLFVPAIAIMVAVGGLIGSGLVDPIPVLVCAIVGAVLGDWVSYAIGGAMGSAIYRHRWLRGHRLAFARARLFFRRFGFAAILLGRFLGPVRSTVPVVAGVLKMPSGPFQLANILSAILWVPALLAPGYFAGARLAEWGLGPNQFLMMAAGLCFVPLIFGWFAVRIFNRPRKRQG